jgi:hypothetical protein
LLGHEPLRNSFLQGFQAQEHVKRTTYYGISSLNPIFLFTLAHSCTRFFPYTPPSLLDGREGKTIEVKAQEAFGPLSAAGLRRHGRGRFDGEKERKDKGITRSRSHRMQRTDMA